MAQIEAMLQRWMKPLASKDGLKEVRQYIATVKDSIVNVNTRVDGVEARMQSFRGELSALTTKVHEKDLEEPMSGCTRRTSTGAATRRGR